MDIARLLAPLPEADPPSPVTSAASSPRFERTGVWLAEEEEYMLALIECFTAGLLPTVAPGTSLRSFVALRLACSPMRVSKKLAALGTRLRNIGRTHYEPAHRPLSADDGTKIVWLGTAEARFTHAMAPATPTRYANTAMFKDEATKVAKTTTGFWFGPEQVYAAKLIEYFVQGALELPCGLTLRGFLAERLRCSPMRVSKKLATGMLAGRSVPRRIGTAVFVPQPGLSVETQRRISAELQLLRRDCFECKAHRWTCASIRDGAD